MLKRFGLPSKLDESPQGTKLRVDHGETFDLYIQISHDEQNPHWEFIGNFTEDSYKLYLQNETAPKS